MVQAADRRQLGATSTPPSLPAPGWRRDLSETTPEILIDRVPLGALSDGAGANSEAVPLLRPPDRPAAVMVLAPLIGLALWVGLSTLLI
jgi:hypothetical protein